MTLFQTNILKLTKTANQIWSPKLQEKFTGHLYLTTRMQGSLVIFQPPRERMKNVSRISLETDSEGILAGNGLISSLFLRISWRRIDYRVFRPPPRPVIATEKF